MKAEEGERGSEQARFIDRLHSSPASERRGLLVQFLREQFAALLGIEPPRIAVRDNLLELGVDSLKAVELKCLLESNLDLQLSSSLLYDYPNLDGLARFLLAQTFDSPTPPISPPCQSKTSPVDPSEHSLAELLAGELEEIKSSGAI